VRACRQIFPTSPPDALATGVSRPVAATQVLHVYDSTGIFP